MSFARHRGLPALIGIALATGLVSVGSPARADEENTAPTASYSVDSAALWAGQHVQLTESGLTDDTTPADAVTRTIAWGDGASETAAAGTTTWQHTYARAGSYDVQVTLNDGALDGAGAFPAGSTVAVTASPGSYSWRQPTIYTFPDYMEQGTMLGGGLPANASRVWTAWPDGETSLLAPGATASVAHWFGVGSWTPQVTLQNAQGKATPKGAAPLTVLGDTTPPSVSLTTPSSPSKAASWSTIQGKASDSQSGPDVVGVQLWKYNNTTDYYYDFSSRKWVSYHGQAVPQTAQALTPVSSSGAWKVTSSGLSKGYNLQVYYYAWDKVGNSTDPFSRTYYLNS